MKYHKLKAWIKAHPKWSWAIALIIGVNYPWFYFGGPIEGYVYDKQSKEPIKGAIAVFQFSVDGPSNIFHGSESFTIALMEAVTDENGHYKFPWWVSKKRPFKAFYSSGSFIGFYKIGYKRALSNNLNRSNDKARLKLFTSFSHSEEPVLMEKYKNLEAELKILREFSSLLKWGVGYGMNCSWEKVPNFMIENDKRMRLYKRNLREEHHLYLQGTIGQWTSWKDEGCSDPKIVFKEHLKSLPRGEIEK